MHTETLKKSLNHWVILQKLQKVLEFNREAQLKPYVDMNAKLITKSKNDSEKDFFKLMKSLVFGRTMGKVRKYRNIKLVTTDRKRFHEVGKLSHNRLIFKKLLAMEQNKTKVKINKSVYVGLLIVGISKITINEYWYDYTIHWYGDKAKLCYIDTDSFMVHVKSEDVYPGLERGSRDKI